MNYQPERTDGSDPGEADLICARDGQILVLEVKSTFLRKSQKDAWLHRATTLHKAGLQLRRKVESVQFAVQLATDLTQALGIGQEDTRPVIRGWIVDTSIEHDHDRFSGFLKVSLEEVLIALRDDRHFLNDPEGWFSGRHVSAQDADMCAAIPTSTLYSQGFSADRFVTVIESGAVWDTDTRDPLDRPPPRGVQ